MLQLTRPGSTAFMVGVLLSVTLLPACSSENIPGVYRINIQQGNVVSQDMLDQLEPGMDRRKVRFILGTPMLTDTFNENRWDYFYSLREGNSDPVQRSISVFFEDDKLARVEGDIRPASARRPLTPRKETIVTVPPNYEGEGFLSALRPEFLGGKKTRRRVVEETEASSAAESGATQEAATAVTDAPVTQTAAATPPPAPVPVPSASDQAYLKQLFSGFGKASPGAVSPSAEPEQAAARSPVVYEDDDQGIKSSDADAGDEAAADDGGFIKRLIDRLRKTPEETQPPSGSEASAVPSAPETAAP
ncbi:MAG TPA: outer membrane protein assembly factor BamE [Gammaproteobacteria bacterium]